MKKLLAIAFCLIIIFSVLSCTRSTDYIIGHKPSVWGTVTEIRGDSILIAVNEDEELYEEYKELWVSGNVRNKDGSYSGRVGDEVAVYYDGGVTAAEPARLETVYGIFIITPAGRD